MRRSLLFFFVGCSLCAAFASAKYHININNPFALVDNPPAEVLARGFDATTPESVLIEQNPGAVAGLLLYAWGNRLDPADVPSLGGEEQAILHDIVSTPEGLRFLRQIVNSSDDNRQDKQCGSTPGAAGTTSTSVGTGIAEVLCAALESGAASESVQGNVVTIRGNAENFTRALAGQPIQPGGKGTTPLSKVEVFAIFNTNTPGAQSATLAHSSSPTVVQNVQFIPDPKTLSSAGLRWNPHNDHANVSDEKIAYVLSYLSHLPRRVLASAFTDVVRSPQYTSLRNDVHRHFTPAQSREYIRQVVLVSLQADPDLGKHLFRAARLYDARSLISATNSGSALTAEYTYNRPYNQAIVHTARAAFDYSPKDSFGNFTGNFAVDFFGGDGKEGQLRDLQVSVSLNRKLGDNGSFILSGYDQYQRENALLHLGSGNLVPGTQITLNRSAETLLAPKGNIAIVGVVFNITSGTGPEAHTVIPIGFTYSNRTDLFKGSELRGHVGIQFDPSHLFH